MSPSYSYINHLYCIIARHLFTTFKKIQSRISHPLNFTTRQPTFSNSPNLPFQILHTDLLPGFLVIIEPLPLAQINTCELRGRFCAAGGEFPDGDEFGEFEAAAIEDEDRLAGWWGGGVVRSWEAGEGGGGFALLGGLMLGEGNVGGVGVG